MRDPAWSLGKRDATQDPKQLELDCEESRLVSYCDRIAFQLTLHRPEGGPLNISTPLCSQSRIKFLFCGIPTPVGTRKESVCKVLSRSAHIQIFA